LALLAVVLGVFSATTLKQEMMPSMDLPQGAVVAVYPGASPEVVEAEVAKPIEAAIQGVAGVTQVTSTSASNVATISMTWDYGDDAGEMVNQLNTAVDSISSSLPSSVTTRVITGGLDDMPVLMLAVSSAEDLTTLSKNMDDIAVPDLKGIEGVRDVTVSGEEGKEISIVLDQGKVQDKGVDQTIISSMYLANGMAIPAGTIRSENGNFDVTVGNSFASVKEIEDLLIQTADDPVRLGDIAEIKEITSQATGISRVNGRPSLTIAVTKTLDGNTVAVAHAVKEHLAILEQTLGSDTQFKIIFDQSPFIEDSIRDLSVEGGIGLVMAVVVIMLFLWSWRPTVITAISIPLSLLIALAGLWIGGDTLNILTLGAMTVAIGRVVDDSIVIIENIKRHQAMGHVGRGYIVSAVKEVAGAVTSSTLTTVAVFLPMGLVSGQVGELFRPFAMTVAIALLASLAVSMTVIPVLASWFMRAKGAVRVLADDAPTDAEASDTASKEMASAVPETNLRSNLMQRIYVPALNWTLAHKAITLLIAAGLFAGTLALVPNLKTDFIGDMGSDIVQVSLKLPSGTGLEKADAAAGEVEKLLAQEDGIDAYQTSVGGGSGSMMAMMMGGSSASNSVSITISMRDGVKSAPMVERLRRELEARPVLGTAKVGAGASAGAGSNVVVYVESNDPEKLEAGSQAVSKMLAGVDGLVNVSSDLDDEQSMIKLNVEEEKAAKKGYTKATIGQALQRAIRGQQIGTMVKGDSTLDVYLKSQTPVDDVGELENVLLPVTQQMTMQARLDAADKVSKKADAFADDAKADAKSAYNKQIKAMKKAKTTANKQVKKLKKQLSAAQAKLNTLAGQLGAAMSRPADQTNPGASIASVALSQQVIAQGQMVAGLSQGVMQASAGIAQIDQQLSAAQKQWDSSMESQDKQAELTQEGKDAQKVKAKPIKVSAVADIEVVEAPAKISRVSGSRAATITAVMESADLSSVNAAVAQGLDDLDLADGVTVRIGGVSEQQSSAFRDLGLAMLVAIGVVYLIMVATFGSLLQPVILLVSIPFAATGALGLSLLTDTALGVPSMIGLLMLIGIVVTNAIVLIDLINQYRKRGEPVDISVRHGAALRVRPIVMTALATIFALLPMGLGLTGGSVFISKPLAIVVMGGLISSTLLTLFLVPVLYDILEKFRERLSGGREARRAKKAVEEIAGQDVVPAQPPTGQESS
jgi:HAE1 family hydrophobic/amphiphilic exporter-1